MRNVLTLLSGFMVSAAMATLGSVAWAGTPAAPSPVWGDPHSSSYLGVHIDDVTPDRAAALKLKDTNGAVITDLDQDGPACRGGLQENDVIVTFNGSKVINPGELADLIHATTAGQKVSLSVIRDGQKKDLQVTMGSQGQIVARATAPEKPRIAMHSMPYPASMAPDIEVPVFTTLSARHGMVVESLSPQLSAYFGVPQGRGVLLRSVEKGSSAEAAGLKAGDVIVKVNGEDVHDIADWRRTMHAHSGKTSISFVREKREQTVEVTLPGSGNSKLGEFDWDGFNQEQLAKDMQAFQKQMESLRPEIERSQKEIIASVRPNQKDMQHMQHELQKSMRLSQKDLEHITRDLQKSLPSEKQLAEMRSQLQKSAPTQKQIDEMIQQSLPTQKQMDEMRRQLEDSMKNWTPQLQQQMEELKKQMEQFKLDWQTNPANEREF